MLTINQQDELLYLLGKNMDVFATDGDELGCVKDFQYKIETGNAPPVHSKAYKTTPLIREELDKQIDKLLRDGVITESTSCWSSPCLLVKKRDGSYRFVVDFRKLNAYITPSVQVLPDIDTILEEIADKKATFFTNLDVKNAFWNIPLDPSTRHKTAFATHRNLYEFCRLPFGLSSSPAVFQTVLQKIFSKLAFKFLVIYMDDILLFSRSFEDHITHLEQTFKVLRDNNLKLNGNKCNFAVSSVPYLGHVISKDGVKTSPTNTESIRSFPKPSCVKEVQRFLGMCNYYRKFIKNYSLISAPLFNLLKKDVPFLWTEQIDNAFQNLKQIISSDPMLVLPSFEKPFILYTDASDVSISYVLAQKDSSGRERPVCFGGRAIKSHELKWPTYEKEALAVVAGVSYYRKYLEQNNRRGIKFILLTDNSAVTFLLNNNANKGRISRWSLQLQQYQFEIKHIAGTKNVVADALSRRQYDDSSSEDCSIEQPEIATVSTDICMVQFQFNETQMSIDSVTKDGSPILSSTDVSTHLTNSVNALLASRPKSLPEYQRDDSTWCGPMIKYLETNTLPEDEKLAALIQRNGHLYALDENNVLVKYKELRFAKTKFGKIPGSTCVIMVPPALTKDIMQAYHDKLGHQGEHRTRDVIATKYQWEKMSEDIKHFVRTCEPCQQAKRAFHQRPTPLRPLPPTDIFSRWHMDILGPITETPEGYKYILLFADSFSKWIEAVPLKEISAITVANALHKEIICRYGSFQTLVSDRAMNFMSSVVKELCKIYDIQHRFITAYHAQANAACERQNSRIAQSLRTLVDSKHSNWANVLPVVVQSYNVTPANQSTHLSPYFILFGRECVLPVDTSLNVQKKYSKGVQQYVSELLENVQIGRQLTKQNIKHHNEIAKQYYNKLAKDPKFKPGDKVWLDNPVARPGLSKKLDHKFVGPYYISDYGSNFTYKLRALKDNKPHKSRVHASRLKRYFPREDIDHDSASREIHPSPPVNNKITKVVAAPNQQTGHVKAKVQGKLRAMHVPIASVPKGKIRTYYIRKDIREQRNAKKK
jgi:transposase InsO family protein